MINLNQNAYNTNVVLDLTANSDLFIFSSITPYFLFEFKSEATGQLIYFVTDNTAALSARTRYDQFTITTTGSTFINLTAGTINLDTGNLWLYNVYQQTTRDNLDPSQTNGIVNTGRVFYSPNITNNYVYFTGSTNNIYFKEY